MFQTLATYVGSSFVGQFNKFGLTFQVYAQADARVPPAARGYRSLPVRNQHGDMIPLGTMVTIEPIAGAPLVSLYNLYPSST